MKGRHGCSYDGNGNLRQKLWEDEGNVNGWTYVYDCRNRLKEVYEGEGENPSAILAAYAYDYAGNRVAKAVKNGYGDLVTTQHLIDNNNLTGYSQVLLDIDYPSGTISARYDYGDDLFAQIDSPESSAPDPHYLLYDGLGSTRSLTDNQGQIEQTYSYKPFGEANGFDPGAENQLTRNLFTGEQFDAETGYYHLRARQYDPRIGRFTSFDPAEDFQNRLHKYVYCSQNPVNHIDPSGTFSLIQCAMVASIIGIIALSGIDSAMHGGSFIGGAIQTAAVMALFFAGFAVLSAILPTVALVAVGLFFVALALWTQKYAIEEAILLKEYDVAGIRITQGALAILLLFLGFKTRPGATKESFFSLMAKPITRLVKATKVKFLSWRAAAAERPVTVCRWGRPGLKTGDWIMVGNKSWLNYVLSFKWQPGAGNKYAESGSGAEYIALGKDVSWPRGWSLKNGWYKGLFGQRLYKGPDGGR